jgi:hypothetical protein
LQVIEKMGHSRNKGQISRLFNFLTVVLQNYLSNNFHGSVALFYYYYVQG